MLIVPDSLQELVGRVIKTISTSSDRRRIIFDTYATRENSRTRYAYEIEGVVDEYFNLTNMVGYEVTSISVAPDDLDGRAKLLITTVDVDGWGLIYFYYHLTEEVGLLTEDDEQIVLEGTPGGECMCLILETETGFGDPIVLADIDVGRGPPYKLDPDGKDYIVEEGDVNYHESSTVVLDCEGECD